MVKNAKERLPQLNKKLKIDPKNPVEEQISIQYSAWDFGGQVYFILPLPRFFSYESILSSFLTPSPHFFQELFYSTHQFFISHRSVYLIVFSLAQVDGDEDRIDRIEYWLKAIRSSNSFSPSILFLLLLSPLSPPPPRSPSLLLS